MGAAFGTLIQTEGHEKLLYKAIKNYILSLSSSIACSEDPEDEFDVSLKGADHVPTLNFSINGTHVFKIYRPACLETGGSENAVTGFRWQMDAVEGLPNGDAFVNFRPSDTNSPRVQSDTGLRGAWFSYIANNIFVYLNIGTFAAGRRAEEQENGGIVYCLSNNIMYLGLKSRTNNPIKSIIFDLSGISLYDGSTPGKVGTFLSRFSYAAPPGSIDYIKSSIYQNNNEKSFENRAVYDSTTVTIGNTVSLKDGSYVAVGTHQLVKVS